MSAAPVADPAAFRAWLLEDGRRLAAWIDDLLTPDEVAQQYPCLGVVGTLANQRAGNVGPAYIRLGRGVYYRRGDLIRYLEQHRVEPTGDRASRLRHAS